MQKTKNKKWLKVAISIMEIIFIVNPFTVFAQQQVDTYDIALNIVHGGAVPSSTDTSRGDENNIGLDVNFDKADYQNNTGGFVYAQFITYSPGVPDGNGGTTPAQAAICRDGSAIGGVDSSGKLLFPMVNLNSALPNGPSPAVGFCAGILSCNSAASLAVVDNCKTHKNTDGTIVNTCTAVTACQNAIAAAYNKKVVDALQAATDKLIKSDNLDETKANDALKACGGNLSCINLVLTTLQADAGFKASTPAEPPLTASSLSDLINSNVPSGPGQVADVNVNQQDLGALNSADNQVGGLGNKQTAPSVSVTFAGGGSQAGSEMTATATPGFFNNASDPTKLYFTWYLKHAECGLTKSTSPGDVGKCDLDGDGKITENDWKVAAAKIIVGKSFDKTGVDYSPGANAGFSDLVAGFEAVPSPIKSKEWNMNSGADSNDKDAPNCYIHEGDSGLDYELRDHTSVFDACPTGYQRACAIDIPALSCTVFNKTTSVAGPATLGALCAGSSASDGVTQSCEIADAKNFKSEVDCVDASGNPKGTSVCLKNGADTVFPATAAEGSPAKGVIFKDANLNNNICTDIFKPNMSVATATTPSVLSTTNPLLSDKNNIFSTIEGQTCATTKSRMIDSVNGDSSLNPTCSFKRDVNMCKHLFAKDPGEVAGDGKFTLKEKQFWGADPKKPSTNGTQKDEEAVIGLGVDKFTWMLAPGDKVGVVVEGDSSIKTDHADSSFKRTWALSKGVCSKLNKLKRIQNNLGFYTEGSGSAQAGFLTAEFDLNDCLEENLLDPNTNGSSNLTVDLAATPTNPVNDPAGNGDILTVSTSAANIQNPVGLTYSWTVQKSTSGSAVPTNATIWTPYDSTTKEMEKEGAFSASDATGLDKNQLNIKLKLSEDDFIKKNMAGSYNGIFYLKINVKIAGTSVDGGQGAQGSIIVRVIQQQNTMRVYSVIAKNDLDLALNNVRNTNGESGELCTDQSEKDTCYVTKNKIIGVTVPNVSGITLSNFTWTVNDVPISCGSDVSKTQCNTVNGNTLFFPVLGEPGEAVDVTATAVATKADKSTESVEITRRFVIVGPELQIMAGNENVWPKLLGYYKDLSNRSACVQDDPSAGCHADYSTQVLEATAGATATLKSTGDSGFIWSIDGEVRPEYQNLKEIQLPISKSPEDSYSVGIEATYSQGDINQANNIRKALLKNWGVSVTDDATDGNSSAYVQVNVVASAGQPVASANSKFFGASLVTHLPEQILFLFKLSLTSLLLFFLTGLLFAFIPERLFKEEV